MNYKPQDGIIIKKDKFKGYILKELENNKYLIVYGNNEFASVDEFDESDFNLDEEIENGRT